VKNIKKKKVKRY